MSLADDVEGIRRQEAALRFPAFSEMTAWDLGVAMHKAAAARKLPLLIDIRIGSRILFHAALPGTVPDNAEWVRRKANSVLRFHRSTYGLGREALLRGRSFEASGGIDIKDYAADGGGFPLTVLNAGVIGAITVSGIPQRDDHGFVVEQLCSVLGQDYAKLALGPE